MRTITLHTPDDWHCHFRDTAYLARTVVDSSRYFKRAVIMPNLNPPVTTVGCAKNYLTRIQKCIPVGSSFTPLMTLYLTDDTTPQEILKASESGIIFACKLYPRGATTHAHVGVSDITALYPVFAAMQSQEMPLLIHGEAVDMAVDIFDREKYFIENTLTALLQAFPHLKIVLEHISTKTAVQFVQEGPDTLGATITAHHLLLNRNALLSDGLHPHHYCLPILKREEDRLALCKAATSGNPKFFLGTDSAPHHIENKESACGCAGIYTAFHALPLYLEIFEQENALDKFEAFASIHGPQFYNLPINSEKITLIKDPWRVPERLAFGETSVVPLLAGEILQWQLVK